MLRIAVVDDDQTFQEQARAFVARYFNHDASAFSLRCFRDGMEFLAEYQSDYDIAMLDIMMPRMNGMDVAHKLRERDKNILVMFITITPAFAIRGYEVAAVDYILKPLCYERDFQYKFDRVVKQALQRKAQTRDLVLKDPDGRFVRINLDDLIYVSKERDNVLYHTRQGVFSQRDSIYKVRDALESIPAFAVVNSGCLVNMAYIDNLSDTVVTLRSGELLTISRSKKKGFYEKFFDQIGR